MTALGGAAARVACARIVALGSGMRARIVALRSGITRARIVALGSGITHARR